jgi:hypothetical protein
VVHNVSLKLKYVNPEKNNRQLFIRTACTYNMVNYHSECFFV